MPSHGMPAPRGGDAWGCTPRAGASLTSFGPTYPKEGRAGGEGGGQGWLNPRGRNRRGGGKDRPRRRSSQASDRRGARSGPQTGADRGCKAQLPKAAQGGPGEEVGTLSGTRAGGGAGGGGVRDSTPSGQLQALDESLSRGAPDILGRKGVARSIPGVTCLGEPKRNSPPENSRGGLAVTELIGFARESL